MEAHNRDENFCTLIGITLIELQRTEFLIQGLISHFSRNILDKDKRFKMLTPEVFLSHEDAAKPLRKQTLGVLFEFLKKETFFFDANRLDLFLYNRNKFIHNMWREEINGKSDSTISNDKALAFANNFAKEILHWQSIFRGMLFLFIEAVGNKHGHKEDFEAMKVAFDTDVHKFFQNVVI